MISVIVPMYNVEKFIGQCASSLLEQTYDNMEFIFIDDCSTDSTIKELQKTIILYPKRKNQIKLIFNPVNKGVASSRNIGLHEAHGKYIIYCDADDWVDSMMYEEMINTINTVQCDIVYCDYYYEYECNRVYAETFLSHSNKSKALLLYDYLMLPYNSLWNMLVSKDLYDNYGIKFLDGHNFCEDLNVATKLLAFSKKIVHIDKAFYHYRENPSSICHSFSREKSMARLVNVMDLMDFFSGQESKKLKRALFYRLLVAKQFLLYDDKDIKNWYNTGQEVNRFILSNSLYGIKAKCIEFLACILYSIILRLITVKI